jgi:hypothetical protein
MKGANRSAPHVLPCTVNFGSHFLPQPSDLVKLLLLVQLLKESMTRRTGYVRGPTVRGRHARPFGRFRSPLHGETLDCPHHDTQSPALISSPNPRIFSSSPTLAKFTLDYANGSYHKFMTAAFTSKFMHALLYFFSV